MAFSMDRVLDVAVCGISWRKSFEGVCRLSDMASPSQSKVDELRAEIERMNEELEDLKEEYGVEDEDDGEEVFIPAGGRTNHKNGVGSTATFDDEPETKTEEVEVAAFGRNNESAGTVEREVPVESGMEEVEEFEAHLHEDMMEHERRRVERQKEARKRRTNEGLYTSEEDERTDASDIPAGGRTNWENRQEE